MLGDNADQMIKQLKRHEGLVTHCYQDHLGYNTIGYGRLIEKGMGGITEAEADYLLMNDLTKFMKTAQSYDYFDKLNEPRKAVCINMLFNLGQSRYEGFQNFASALSAGHYEKAAEEMLSGSNGGKSRWYTQVGRRAEELAEQMRTGKWQQS